MRECIEHNVRHDILPYRQPCCEQKHLLQFSLLAAFHNS
mgnify:CR=1 FL=1